MRNYIAILDREHLENSLFLTTLAQSVSSHGADSGIILHGDSEYTDRLIQTGMMREDARLRACRDLNKRLIGLFADQGASAIGLNAYQKEFIQLIGTGLHVNTKALKDLPNYPTLILSSLVAREESNDNSPYYVEPGQLASALFQQLESDIDIIVFAKDESFEIFKHEHKVIHKTEADNNLLDLIPDELRDLDMPFTLTAPGHFAHWPKLEQCIILK